MDYYLYIGLEIAEEFNNECLADEEIEMSNEEPTPVPTDSEYDEF